MSTDLGHHECSDSFWGSSRYLPLDLQHNSAIVSTGLRKRLDPGSKANLPCERTRCREGEAI